MNKENSVKYKNKRLTTDHFEFVEGDWKVLLFTDNPVTDDPIENQSVFSLVTVTADELDNYEVFNIYEGIPRVTLNTKTLTLEEITSRFDLKRIKAVQDAVDRKYAEEHKRNEEIRNFNLFDVNKPSNNKLTYPLTKLNVTRKDKLKAIWQLIKDLF